MSFVSIIIGYSKINFDFQSNRVTLYNYKTYCAVVNT